MPPRRVVPRGLRCAIEGAVDIDQRLHPSGIEPDRLPRDGKAEAVADQHSLTDARVVQDRRNAPGEVIEGVGEARLIALAMARQVEDENTTPCGQEGDLLAPHRTVAGPAMDQDDRRLAGPVIDVMDPRAIQAREPRGAGGFGSSGEPGNRQQAKNKEDT